MTVDVLALTGEAKDKIELPDAIFGQKARTDLIWDVVNRHLANQRQGNACTKTRAEVSGGGKKPWRQKHTGRARHGSTRSPIWRHGGIVFGPRPHSFALQIPTAKRQKALRVALSMMLAEDRVRVVEDIQVPSGKTKDLATILKNLGVAKGRTLLLVKDHDPMLSRAAGNLPNLDLLRVRDLNVYQAVEHAAVVFTRSAVAHYTPAGAQS